MQLSTSPRTLTTLRLEARKSFAFGLRFVDGDDQALDLTGSTIRFVAAQPQHLGGDSVLEAEADMVSAELGLARFDIQASDLALPAPNEYPFAVVFVSALGYSTLVLKGVVDLQENTESESISAIYPGINPETNLEVVLESGQLVKVSVDHLDGFSLVVEQRIQEFTDSVQGLLDGALAEADEYISEANLAAISAAASALSAAASADAAATIIENALNFDPLGLVPSGAGMEWYDDVPPPGYVMQDGSTVPRTGATAGIFARWGTRFGAGDGSTTFRLPNRPGTVPVALKVSDVDFDTIGKTGGAKGTALTAAHLPQHNHTMNHGHTASASTDGAHSHTGTVGEAGWHTHPQNVTSEAAGGPGIRSDYSEDSGGDGSGEYDQGMNTDGGGQHGHSVTINSGGSHSHSIGVQAHTGYTGTAGAENPTAVSAVQPFFVVNYIMKL